MQIREQEGVGYMNKSEFVRKILETESESMTDAEIISLILEKKVSKKIDDIDGKGIGPGARLADKMADVAGSWFFICIFLSSLFIWMICNIIMLSKAFDPYPFILLNLVLSCLAAIQAPIIMMSQKRQEEKDRIRAENDYKINLKTEIIIEDLYSKVQQILDNQTKNQ